MFIAAKSERIDRRTFWYSRKLFPEKLAKSFSSAYLLLSGRFPGSDWQSDNMSSHQLAKAFTALHEIASVSPTAKRNFR